MKNKILLAILIGLLPAFANADDATRYAIPPEMRNAPPDTRTTTTSSGSALPQTVDQNEADISNAEPADDYAKPKHKKKPRSTPATDDAKDH